MENPRERVINSFSDSNIDFNALVDVLKGQITSMCRNDKKYWDKVENNIEELSNNDEPLLDEPLETIRKLAITIDSYSNLAHIHNESTGEYTRALFLRSQKDFFMRQFIIRCIEANEKENSRIIFGFIPEIGNETLEADIPYLGHIGWHFGRLHNLDGLRSDVLNETGFEVPEYPYDVEPKILRDGLNKGANYSNSDILIGKIKWKELNQADCNLVRFGSRTPPIGEIDI